MGLLDEILKQAGGSQGGGTALGSIASMLARNPQIVSAAMSMLNPRDASVGGTGGLGDVIAAFTKGGHGDIASSWVGGGPNKPIDPGALSSVLGGDVLGQFAQKAGIGAGEAPSVLASILPELVNQLTPQGQVPQGNALDGMIGSLLGQLGRG